MSRCSVSARQGEVRGYGKIANTPAAMKALAAKLARNGHEFRICYKAGPCGYGIQRQLTASEHQCIVVWPQCGHFVKPANNFLLRHSHHYNRPAWSLMHRRWLAGLLFEHAVRARTKSRIASSASSGTTPASVHQPDAAWRGSAHQPRRDRGHAR
jgi:hypothetical protein